MNDITTIDSLHVRPGDVIDVHNCHVVLVLRKQHKKWWQNFGAAIVIGSDGAKIKLNGGFEATLISRLSPTALSKIFCK